ncbi:hypothetical protein HMPREF1651_10090 [Prevotella bivia DNF00188]|uniref:hypothetical protein n=1 Tax=Prevotella bivia TaxID=28125 RepID=UPI00050F8FE5|nr:hypothetical protein [Prevotella bivia]KGF19381.1 hypothetical protein HMPREF1651_10090 [Prevotella bivia DNF00188]
MCTRCKKFAFFTLTLASHPVADTLLLLPDTAWWGNLGRGEHIGTVTRNNLVVASLRKVWERGGGAV